MRGALINTVSRNRIVREKARTIHAHDVTCIALCPLDLSGSFRFAVPRTAAKGTNSLRVAMGLRALDPNGEQDNHGSDKATRTPVLTFDPYRALLSLV